MSGFMHELVARIRATHTRVARAPDGRSRRRDACRGGNAPRAATSRKWVITGLR
jgi:hypothetical protein